MSEDRRFQVSFQLDVPVGTPLGADPLGAAYAFAVQLVAAGCESVGMVGLPVISLSWVPPSVRAGVPPPPAPGLRWTIEVDASDRNSVGMFWDPHDRKSTVMIANNEPPVSVRTVTVSARETARLVRALQEWPVDIMERMAYEDERKRNGGGGK